MGLFLHFYLHHLRQRRLQQRRGRFVGRVEALRDQPSRTKGGFRKASTRPTRRWAIIKAILTFSCDRALVPRTIDVMKSEFQESIWKACWLTVVEDRPAAAEMNIGIPAIHQAKSRLLWRLRQELDGMADLTHAGSRDQSDDSFDEQTTSAIFRRRSTPANPWARCSCAF